MSCQSRLSKLKVLLVEDEKRLAQLLKNAVGDYFAEFEIAYDGIEGLKQFRKMKPDVVITDITMPKMTGLELAEKIKKENPHMPIVILSAYSDKEKLLGAIDVGVVKYFIKPFDPEELLEYLCSLAEKIKKQSLVQLLPPFSFDLQSEQLFKKGVLVHLSKRESRFISLLYHSPNHYLSNEAIKERLWEGEEVSDERLRTFIKRVRQKSDKGLIENVSGQGYVLIVR
ncbi:response regulator transcription factor [Hydrogenimonas urashimensis]|uniref:response regulator transcription factor n=1 Tax=Hydrogenimonas urashimensis TaxID=2740515 RepID=UPI0019169AA4|nr:response regulator transcription factor [Hydrogenimonas urashimensis]